MRTILFIILSIIFYSLGANAQYVWHFQESNTTTNLNYIDFINAETGFVCGDNGLILKTTNKGINWTNINSNTSQKLNSIFIGAGYIWIVGDNGLIIRSSDLGITWVQVNSSTPENINSMDLRFLWNKGYCACDNGIILHSTDRGNTWASVQSPVNSNLNGISRSIICGDEGIRFYRNNLENWILDTTMKISNDLLSIASYELNFRNLICGKDGIMLWKDDNSKWKYVNSNTANDLKKVIFIAAYFSVAVGESGSFLKSANGGLNWETVNLPTNEDINGVYFFNQYTGWIAGNNGVILKTETRSIPSGKIDGNNISTWFAQDGNFNLDRINYSSGFEWPKGSGKKARYSSALCIGAIVNNDTLVAIGDYGRGEFLPGYTSNNGIAAGLEDSAYKIYKLKHGVLDLDRSKWPNKLLSNSDQGAPVYFNAVSGMWEANDYGNQTMFFRLTDSYPESHYLQGGHTSPLKADIKCVNFSFQTQNELNNVLYSHYEIINRSSQIWNKTFFTFFSDDDATKYVGYLGSDTINNLGYTYFRTSDPVYGSNPPAVGFKIIRGANFHSGNQNDTLSLYLGKNNRKISGYKTRGLYSFNWFYDDGPGDFADVYRCMEGKRLRWGTPILTPEGIPTRHYFSGDPETNTGWTMPNSVGA